MKVFDVISLLGGLAMFLYGMRLMGDALKENSSGTLKIAMGKVTNNPFKAFILGLLVTALIQSSTATIVITAGLVGAGILTLHQSLGIIIGANVGTTVTGQIIRLLDVNSTGTGSVLLQFFQPSTLAPVALVLGMVLIMGNFFKKANSVGRIAVGFGILFSGLLNMTGAVSSLQDSGFVERVFSSLTGSPVLGYAAGAGVAFVLQSSSATIGILQAFSSSGMMTFKTIYPIIVGVYLGDCVTTAIVCSIGTKEDARRVGFVNILFNLCKTVLVLAAVALIHELGLLDRLWNTTANSSVIANTNTVFNLCCALVFSPMLGIYEKISRHVIKDSPTPESRFKTEADALNPVFFNTPALALQSCYKTLLAIFSAARANLERAFSLLEKYDPAVQRDLLADEDEIDHMTDQVSKYMVEFLPHLKLENHVAIINQYYKITSEFERLGDHAVNIADRAEALNKNNTSFSPAAMSELAVLESAVRNILSEAEQAFAKRDVEAAERIEPLAQVVGDLAIMLRRNHLRRMSIGACDTLADADFTGLLEELHRIGDLCSNVGVATVVRVHPELADHEHFYFERLHAGVDETFNAAYSRAYEKYAALLENTDDIPETEPAP